MKASAYGPIAGLVTLRTNVYERKVFSVKLMEKCDFFSFLFLTFTFMFRSFFFLVRESNERPWYLDF